MNYKNVTKVVMSFVASSMLLANVAQASLAFTNKTGYTVNISWRYVYDVYEIIKKLNTNILLSSDSSWTVPFDDVRPRLVTSVTIEVLLDSNKIAFIFERDELRGDGYTLTLSKVEKSKSYQLSLLDTKKGNGLFQIREI